MQLPWRSDEGRGEGGATAGLEANAARTRTHRWRRVVARPVVATPAAPACTPAVTDVAAPACPPESRRGPGLVAVAIARILIAIDFALGGRR